MTPAPAAVKTPPRQAHDAPQVAIVQQLALGLDEGGLVGAEQHAFVEDDAAAAARLEAVDDVLEEQHLGRAGLVGEPGLRFLALLAAERRVRQDHVVERRRVLEQAAVGLLPGQRVAVPDVRLVDAVEDQVGQGDGVDQVLLLAPVEGALLAASRAGRRWRRCPGSPCMYSKVWARKPPVPQPGS